MLNRYAHLSPAHLWQAVEGLTQLGTVTKTVTITDEERGESIQVIDEIGAGNGI